MSQPSAAIIRYRARVAERAFIREEIRKRIRMLDQLMREFDSDKDSNVYWRLRRYSIEAERISQLIDDLPAPRRPTVRKRKAKVLRLVRQA